MLIVKQGSIKSHILVFGMTRPGNCLDNRKAEALEKKTAFKKEMDVRKKGGFLDSTKEWVVKATH